MKRDKSIDALKAFGICCVVLGHISASPFHDYYYTFHVPLFFFVSGMLVKRENMKGAITKQARKYLLPYFFFWFVSMVLYRQGNSILTTGHLAGYNIEHFKGLILAGGYLADYSNNYPIWFLQTSFFIGIVFTLINNLANDLFKFILMLFLAGISLPIYKLLPFRPIFRMDVVPVGLVFMLCGYFYKKYLYSTKLCTLPISLLLIFTGFLIAINNGGNLTNIKSYVYYPGALCTIIGYHLLFRCYLKNHRAISIVDYLGANTLWVLGLHILTFKDSRKIAGYIFSEIGLTNEKIIPLIMAFISISVCLGIKELYTFIKGYLLNTIKVHKSQNLNLKTD